MDINYLRKILDYNMETGEFYWKVSKSIGTKVGSRAGTINTKGYLKILIDYKKYAGHRLAWFYVTGEMPPSNLQIDHINRVRDDNRFSNLRLVTNKQNQENTNIRKDNSSGITGINWMEDRQKWCVRIQSNGVRTVVGYYTDFQEASNARKEAELINFTHREKYV